MVINFYDILVIIDHLFQGNISATGILPFDILTDAARSEQSTKATLQILELQEV